MISQFQNHHQLTTVNNPNGSNESAPVQQPVQQHHPITTGLEGEPCEIQLKM